MRYPFIGDNRARNFERRNGERSPEGAKRQNRASNQKLHAFQPEDVEICRTLDSEQSGWQLKRAYASDECIVSQTWRAHDVDTFETKHAATICSKTTNRENAFPRFDDGQISDVRNRSFYSDYVTRVFYLQ